MQQFAISKHLNSYRLQLHTLALVKKLEREAFFNVYWFIRDESNMRRRNFEVYGI